MADFCNKCAKDMFGEGYVDIDVPKIFEELKEGTYMSVICEGCSMAAIGKEKGKLIMAFYPLHYSESEDPLTDHLIKWEDANIEEYVN